MKRKVEIAALWMIFAGAGLAACAHQSEVATTMEMGTPGETVDGNAVLPSWQALVTPPAGGEVAGEVAIRATEGGETYTSIAVEFGEPGHTYPWHIHSGDCGSSGPIVGAATAYPPIVVDAGGEGKASATIAAMLDPDDGDYYVNVHRSPEDLATIIACGQVESQ